MYFFKHPVQALNHLIARVITDEVTFYASIILFFAIAFTYKKPFFADLDKKTFERIDLSENLKGLMDKFTLLGNAVFHILYSLILAIIFYVNKGEYQIALAFTFVQLFSWGLNRALKLLFRRERPTFNSEVVTKRKSFCFPSGHVMASIPTYFFSAMILQSYLTFLPCYILALIASIIVILPRVALSHHFVTDVIAGVFAGIVCYKISIWFYFSIM